MKGRCKGYVPSMECDIFQCLHQCGGSGMFIPYPGSDFFHPGSRILIEEFKYFNPKKSKKMVF
jgi:hypothetical protein